MGARAHPRQAMEKGDSAVTALSEVFCSLEQQQPSTLPKGMYLSVCFTGDGVLKAVGHLGQAQILSPRCQ